MIVVGSMDVIDWSSSESGWSLWELLEVKASTVFLLEEFLQPATEMDFKFNPAWPEDASLAEPLDKSLFLSTSSLLLSLAWVFYAILVIIDGDFLTMLDTEDEFSSSESEMLITSGDFF